MKKRLLCVVPVSYTHLDVYKRQAAQRVGGYSVLAYRSTGRPSLDAATA